MKRTKILLVSISAAAFITFSLIGGCGGSDLKSRWRDREIEIDGRNTDWAGYEVYYDEDNGLKAGISNDGQNIYLCIYTWDRKTQMQILARGLTVWFDPEGGKKERFGIEYPVKRMGMRIGEGEEMDTGERMRRERPEFHREGAGDEDNAEMLNDMLDQSRGEMVILGPEENARLSVPAEDAGKLGIEASIDIAHRILVYELKIPMSADGRSRYALDTKPGAKIGIGLKVGAMDRMHGRGSSGPGGGMRPGGGTGGPEGGMGGPGGGMGKRPSFKSLDIWTKVELAVK